MKIPKEWHWCGKKHHTVEIIKDGNKEIVVYKHWLISRKCWKYEAEERWLIEAYIQKEKQTGR